MLYDACGPMSHGRSQQNAEASKIPAHRTPSFLPPQQLNNFLLCLRIAENIFHFSTWLREAAVSEPRVTVITTQENLWQVSHKVEDHESKAAPSERQMR